MDEDNRSSLSETLQWLELLIAMPLKVRIISQQSCVYAQPIHQPQMTGRKMAQKQRIWSQGRALGLVRILIQLPDPRQIQTLGTSDIVLGLICCPTLCSAQEVCALCVLSCHLLLATKPAQATGIIFYCNLSFLYTHNSDDSDILPLFFFFVQLFLHVIYILQTQKMLSLYTHSVFKEAKERKCACIGLLY